ncbi:hypothetical protein F4809DRAFT_294690 [Biscogniauxia mediterranea]|nr:hypothetical protein F4809DRAFT_294690 [Biscogniauxia mediterranea]
MENVKVVDFFPSLERQGIIHARACILEKTSHCGIDHQHMRYHYARVNNTRMLRVFFFNKKRTGRETTHNTPATLRGPPFSRSQEPSPPPKEKGRKTEKLIRPHDNTTMSPCHHAHRFPITTGRGMSPPPPPPPRTVSSGEGGRSIDRRVGWWRRAVTGSGSLRSKQANSKSQEALRHSRTVDLSLPCGRKHKRTWERSPARILGRQAGRRVGM